MAAGALVPHALPDGRVLMVPSYLALPDVAAPSPAPDLRFAGPGAAGPMGDMDAPPDTRMLADQDAAASAEAFRKKLQPSPNEHPAPPRRDQELAALGGKSTTVNPSELVNVTKPPAAAQPKAPAPGSPGTISDSVKEVGEEIANRPMGRGSPGGLAVSGVKQEVQPGVDLLPEQKWRFGLEKRPDLGQEVDPNAPQFRDRKTLEMPAPTMRPVKTGLERGAEGAGEQARSNFELQEQARQEQSVAQKSLLARQSQLLDQQLGVIADRRARIAALQDTATQRAQEANSLEPRTRAEVWGSKGNTGRAMAVLAAVLGGFAGNHNGWDMVDKSVQEAVDDDRSKWERAQRAGLNARNDFERAMQLYGDQDMAAIDVRNRKLANMMAMTQQQITDRGADALSKQRGQALYQQAYDQYLKSVQQLHEMATGKVTKEEVNLANKPATGGGKAPTKLEMLKGMAEATKYEDEIMRRQKAGQAKGAVILPDGSTAYAGSDAEAAKVQNVLRSSEEVKDYVKRLDRLTADTANRVPTSDERAQAEVIQSALVPKLHDAMGVSTFRKDVAELMETMRGDPAHFFRNPNTRARLGELIREMDQNTQSQLKYLKKDPLSSGESESAAPPTAPGFREEGDD